MARYKLTVSHDDEAENPCDWGQFKVVSFNRRHVSFANPDSIDKEELKSLIAMGRAWMLDYSEHGNCMWSLSNDHDDPDDWDYVSARGVLYLTNYSIADSDDARKFLETYTQWCNGAVYWYNLEKVPTECCPTCHRQFDNEEVSSCGFFYNADEIVDAVMTYLTEGDELKMEDVSGMLHKELFQVHKVIVIK